MLDAARPLVVEHGRTVRTKDVAAAAEIAEGTLFRVFATKDALIDAVVADAFDPAPFLRRLEEVDPNAPLEERILVVVEAFLERFRGAFELMTAVGLGRPPEGARGQWPKRGVRPPHQDWRSEVGRLVVEIIGPDADRLTVPPEQVAQYLRLLCFSGVHPHIAAGAPLAPRQIVDVVLHGVLEVDRPC